DWPVVATVRMIAGRAATESGLGLDLDDPDTTLGWPVQILACLNTKATSSGAMGEISGAWRWYLGSSATASASTCASYTARRATARAAKWRVAACQPSSSLAKAMGSFARARRRRMAGLEDGGKAVSWGISIWSLTGASPGAIDRQGAGLP